MPRAQNPRICSFLAFSPPVAPTAVSLQDCPLKVSATNPFAGWLTFVERRPVRYKNPTLVETFTELHLEPGTLTEARFFDVVPKLKELGFTEVEFATGGLKLDLTPGRTGMPRETQRVRSWRPGRRELAQVAEDLFVVNLTGEYPGWGGFTRLFNEC